MGLKFLGRIFESRDWISHLVCHDAFWWMVSAIRWVLLLDIQYCPAPDRPFVEGRAVLGWYFQFMLKIAKEMLHSWYSQIHKRKFVEQCTPIFFIFAFMTVGLKLESQEWIHCSSRIREWILLLVVLVVHQSKFLNVKRQKTPYQSRIMDIGYYQKSDFYFFNKYDIRSKKWIIYYFIAIFKKNNTSAKFATI